MDHRIVSAIQNRQRITLNYDPEPGERLLEPHTYGLEQHKSRAAKSLSGERPKCIRRTRRLETLSG